MNVVKEDNSKKQKKLRILYITLISICIIALMIALAIQIANENSPNYTKPSIVSPSLTQENINADKEQFINMFQNKVNYLANNKYKISRINENEQIVYTGYQKNEKKEGKYDIKVNIPYINIEDEDVKQFNNQIKEIFEEKTNNVLNSQNNAIYTVDYCGYVSNNILSVVVRSTLKEGANAQRDIVQTYNYDLANHKKCTINEMLELKGLTKNQANKNIENEIKKSQERVEDLAQLGLDVFPRDYTSDIYSINNVTEYFLGENNLLYIIFAYGNKNHTSEMDIVIM